MWLLARGVTIDSIGVEWLLRGDGLVFSANVNVELTEYEKKQEEEAIISYDELLKVKDKIYNLTEDEETDEFIDELKSFRLDL